MRRRSELIKTRNKAERKDSLSSFKNICIMGKTIITFILVILYSTVVLAITPPDTVDTALSIKLEALFVDFDGDAGVYVHHLKNGSEVAINADDIYPTASMIKVPIMLTLFAQMESGNLAYGDKLIYKDSLFYSSEDILGSFKDGEEIALSKLVMLMITLSDNTASLWCQQLAGTGTEINSWLEDAGMKHTRMNSRTPGRKKNWEKYGWRQTTPREMASLATMIKQGNAISSAASEEMYRVMGNIYWRSEALSQIPPNIATASKQGAVSQSRSEVVMVNAPSGDYVFCVITKNQKDSSWEHSNAGYQLIRTVSKTIWDHYEPNSPYTPAADYLKWVK